jgi:LPS export ABC transporter protein LptC
MDRKKKLRFIQITLLALGILTIFFTYIKDGGDRAENLISSETKRKIEKQISNQKSNNQDIFYNIEYSGFDLNGNRYNIKSKEATNSKEFAELVNMKFVEAKFYFKDNTILNITSDYGKYNNKSLDVEFFSNVNGNYLSSKLFAQKAEYSNSEGFVVVSKDVKIIDKRGTMFAEKLLFDIKEETLKITSEKNEKIKANINLK